MKLALALHRQITEALVEEIARGRLKPGDRIPYEHELMQTYGCSRMTVSRAISALTAQGLIERRRRAGSFVRARHLSSKLSDIPDLETEILAQGQAYRFGRLDHNLSDSDDGPVLRLSGLHFRGDQVFAHESRRIHLSHTPDVQATDFGPGSPGHWLLQHCPWDEAETEITAIAASHEIACQLKLSPGAACLSLKRTTYRHKHWVTRVTQVFSGTSYALTLRLISGRP